MKASQSLKTLVYSTHGFDQPFLEAAGLGKQALSFTKLTLNAGSVTLAQDFDAVALFTSDDASAAILETLHAYGLKYIALRSVGHDHVDLAKAEELGMKVANVPTYSPYAVAEYAVAMLLALNRKILLSQQLMQHDDFRLAQLVGFDLQGKTVGVVGTGRIGAAFARIMTGFGCKLLGYDIEPNAQLSKEIGLSYTTLEELCTMSDVVSLHCPLNEATTYMFNQQRFEQMKKGVIFINTARGGIVNTVDLLAALDRGNIGCAGLDVYENEKPIFFNDHADSPIEDALFAKLRVHPKVLLTGHQAFLTNEALQGIAETTIGNLVHWGQSGTSENDLF